jgi:hypothetical protein
MRLSRPNSNPRKLSLKEMWRLYNTIKYSISKEDILVDEILSMMEKIDVQDFKSALRIMYGNQVNYLEKNPIEIALMFVRGLKETALFDFYEFIEVIRGDPKRRPS